MNRRVHLDYLMNEKKNPLIRIHMQESEKPDLSSFRGRVKQLGAKVKKSRLVNFITCLRLNNCRS
jgi:hypothetical protein